MQADRQTDRQTDRHKYRHADRNTSHPPTGEVNITHSLKQDTNAWKKWLSVLH